MHENKCYDFKKQLPTLTDGSLWNYDPWGGECVMRFQKDGEIWMIKNDGRAANKSCCWKTLDGQGK